jgi:hypothetical protein
MAAWVCLMVAVSACDQTDPPVDSGAAAQPTTSATSPPPQVLATSGPAARRPAPPVPTRPAPPTFTPAPVPVLPLRIAAELEPPTPRAGADFVLRLTVANDGDRAAHGVYVATSGPWERWTALEVLPTGRFGRDPAGSHIVSPIEISPHQMQVVEVRVRADEPSEDRLTFAVREAEPGDIR